MMEKEKKAKTHRDLRVWSESIQLAESIYRVTAVFPEAERFGLAGQMRRAAVSAASNIAEGAGRNSSKEFLNFLGVARGSLAELETQLILAGRLGYVMPDHSLLHQCRECARLLSALINAIRHRVKG